MLKIIDDREGPSKCLKDVRVGEYFESGGTLYRSLRVEAGWVDGRAMKVLIVESGEVLALSPTTLVRPIKVELHLVGSKEND